MPRKAVIIHSPGSGRSAQMEQALTALREADIEIVEKLSIKELDTQKDTGLAWKAGGIDLIIAAGGDGLVGGVTAQILNSGLPLGILPLGTANDVARSIQMPLDPRQAALAISTGTPIDVDIGIAHPAEQAPLHSRRAVPTSTEQSMFFTHALTVGLNVQFARMATDAQVRQRFGSMTYPYAVLEALRQYQSVELEIHIEGLRECTAPGTYTLSDKEVTLRCRAAQATVVNAPIFWGAFQASVPGVSLSDRLLDIVVVEDAAIELLLLRITRFFSRQEQRPPSDPYGWHAQYSHLYAAELTDIPGIHHVQARSIAITSQQGVLDATLDGEIRGQTPVHAMVSPRRLWLIIPPSHHPQPSPLIVQ